MLNIQGGWQSMGTAILLKFAKNFGVAPSLVSKKQLVERSHPGKFANATGSIYCMFTYNFNLGVIQIEANLRCSYPAIQNYVLYRNTSRLVLSDTHQFW